LICPHPRTAILGCSIIIGWWAFFLIAHTATNNFMLDAAKHIAAINASGTLCESEILQNMDFGQKIMIFARVEKEKTKAQNIVQIVKYGQRKNK
jgi:hypothetical protein